jgi:hypothetical protein
MVTALETREAPQWALPALGAVGASFAAVAAQMFVQPAAATEYVDVRIADPIAPADSSKVIETRAAETRFVIGTDIQPSESWNDGFLPSLGTFDSDPAVRGAMAAPAGELVAAASFTGDPFLELGGSGGERPFDGGITSLPGELDSGGGGDGPIATSKAPPAAASSPSSTNPTQPAPSQTPSTPTTPAASSSSTDAALAHGLANPLSPTLSPTPTKAPSSPTKHGPHVSALSIPNLNPGILAVGADAGSAPTVKVYNAKTLKLSFTINAYASTFTGGVRVAVGVNGDGSTDIITAPGPGGGSLVKVWSGSTGALLQSFNAYSAGQTDGVYVAAGDVNGDGFTDIITGTDAGYAPLVKVFSGKDDSLLTSFISDPTAGANGVRVASADVNGDGFADIITGAGPGGPPRVTVVDGATGQQIWNFFAYDESFMGGVYVAAGDLNGDGKADIITGEGAGGLPQVNAYSGATLASLGSFLAYDSTFTGGVRVGAVDPNGGGLDEILTGAGPGGRETRVWSGQTFTEQSGWYPYGGGFSAGLFVGGNVGNGGGGGAPVQPLDPSLPTVTVQATTKATNELTGTPPGVFTITRTGSTANSLTVNFGAGGSTATVPQDWTGFGAGTVTILAGSSSATVSVTELEDSQADGPHTVVLNILANNQSYNIGNPGSAAVLFQEDLPVPVPNQDCGCASGGAQIMSTNSNVAANPISEYGSGPVRMFDGIVKIGMSELSSAGFGISWGQDLSWTNGSGYAATSFTGAGTVLAELPYLQQNSGSVALITVLLPEIPAALAA